MADQWYYAAQGRQQGPVTEEQLKQLALTGRVKATDLVWKQGMAAWGPASSVEWLFFSAEVSAPPPIPPIPPKDSPPPFPPETAPRSVSSEAATAARKMGASLVSCVRTTGRLLQKRAERATLVKKTIPHAYQALGEHIYELGTYRSDFPEIYARLDGLLAEIAVLEARPAANAVVASFRAVKASLPVAMLKGRATLAFSELGSAAFNKYPELGGAEDALRPLIEARTRLSTVEKEIAGLSQSQPAQIDAPKDSD